MRKLDIFSPSSPELKYFNLESLLLEAANKASLSMITEHARDLIHSANNDSRLRINEVDIDYKVLRLKSDDELRFILEDHLVDGALHSSAHTSARACMRECVGEDDYSLFTQ